MEILKRSFRRFLYLFLWLNLLLLSISLHIHFAIIIQGTAKNSDIPATISAPNGCIKNIPINANIYTASGIRYNSHLCILLPLSAFNTSIILRRSFPPPQGGHELTFLMRCLSSLYSSWRQRKSALLGYISWNSGTKK